MEFLSINWLAVLACVVISMVIGSFWFGPKTFFPAWWLAIGKRADEDPKGSPLTWILMILTCLMQVVLLAVVINALGPALFGGVTLVSGALVGLLVWLGFIAPANLMNKLFASQYKAWLIEAGHHLVAMVIFGAILGAWR